MSNTNENEVLMWQETFVNPADDKFNLKEVATTVSELYLKLKSARKFSGAKNHDISVSPLIINVHAVKKKKSDMDKVRTKVNTISVKSKSCDRLEYKCCGIALRPSTAGGRYHCTACGKKFIHEDSLSRLGSGERTYSCRYCRRSFRQKSNRSRHEEAVCGPKEQRRSSCRTCGRTFWLRKACALHEKFRCAGRPNPCPQCGRSFTRKQELRVHELRHSGRRDHVCTRCGKDFVLSYDLKAHLNRKCGKLKKSNSL